MEINNITEKDIDSLKQLDRIEYRQKCEDCYIAPYSEILCLITAMFLILLSCNVGDLISNTEGIFFTITSIFFSIYSAVLVIVHAKLQKKNLESLNKEYFKIENK